MATDMDVNAEEHDPLPLKKASTPEWQRPYISSVNQLQVPAVIGLLLVMALSCAPGIIQWLTVLRHDHHIGFSFIISLWTGHGLIAVTGVLGYFTMMPLLLTLHAATTAVTGAAMVVNYSMIYFSAEMRCTFLQIGTRGCSDCPCAIDDTCQAAEVGQGAQVSQCVDCEALGRNTCAALLTSGSIASWGGLLMALLLATAAAVAHVTATRIIAQKQALSEAVSDSRAVVADAYDALQADGTLGRHEAGSVAAAVAAVWATGNDTLRDEARALVADAHARGYAAFADVLPATPPPRSKRGSVMPEAAAAADEAELALDMVRPQQLGDTTDFTDSPALSPIGAGAAFYGAADSPVESPVVGGEHTRGARPSWDAGPAEPLAPLPMAGGSGAAAAGTDDSDEDEPRANSKAEKKDKKEKKEKKDKKDKSRMEEEDEDGEDEASGKKGKKDKKQKKDKKEKKSKTDKHDSEDEGKKSKYKRSKSKK